MEIQTRKQPVQGRAMATCAAIEEAAARILTEGGALNTNAIAARAGVSVGTLYQYYPGKEAILAELIRKFRAEMLADLQVAAQEAQGRDMGETTAIMIRAALDHHARDPARAEALERAEASLPLDAETRARKSEVGILVAGVLAAHGVADPETAARDLAAISRGMAEAAVQAGDADVEALATRVIRAARGYLGLPPA